MTMPKVRQRTNIPTLAPGERYAALLKGLEDLTFSSIEKAAEAYGLLRSSLGHCKNGCHNRQEAHQEQQIFTPAAEKAMVNWVLKQEEFGFPPQVDHLMGMAKNLAKEEKEWQVQIRTTAQGNNPPQINLLGKNWMPQFLKRHSVLAVKFVSRIDHQHAYSSNLRINTHFQKLGKILWEYKFKPQGITNVDEKGFVMGISPWT